VLNVMLLSESDPAALAEATLALDAGEAIVIPTDTLYGLAADVFNEQAVVRVFEAKGRPPDVPLPVIVGAPDEVRHVARWTPVGRALARAFWPGGVTLLLPVLPSVPEVVVAGGSTVAVRVPNGPFARALASRFGPITATSANRHGEPPPSDAGSARSQLEGRVRLFVDGGRVAGAPSTIVDATGEWPKVTREGIVPNVDVERAVRNAV
jgi:L-threonylcarbamoyladenylate synthase